MKKLLLYQYLPQPVKGMMRSSLLAFLLGIKKISMERRAGKIILSKGKLSVSVASEQDALEAVRNFEALFSPKEIQPKNNNIDFTDGVRIAGLKVLTTPAGLLDLELAISAYNNFYQLRKGDVVLDCGAFHGLYGLLASRKVGSTGRVYCLEPDSQNFELLTKNIMANGLKNVFAIKKGLWNRNGRVSFAGGTGPGSHVADGGASSISVTTLPDFYRQMHLKRLDFVKMDIEGAELEAISSCIEFISKHRINFAIASYHERDGRKTFCMLEEYFRQAGYPCETSNKKHLTTYAWPKKT